MKNNQYYKEKILKIIDYIERNKRIIKLVVTFIVLTWYFLKFKDIRKQLELLKATNDYNSKSLTVGFEYGFVFLGTAVLVSIFLFLVYRVIKDYINKREMKKYNIENVWEIVNKKNDKIMVVGHTHIINRYNNEKIGIHKLDNSYVITGDFGSGKTYSLNKILTNLAKSENKKLIIFDSYSQLKFISDEIFNSNAGYVLHYENYNPPEEDRKINIDLCIEKIKEIAKANSDCDIVLAFEYNSDITGDDIIKIKNLGYETYVVKMDW